MEGAQDGDAFGRMANALGDHAPRAAPVRRRQASLPALAPIGARRAPAEVEDVTAEAMPEDEEPIPTPRPRPRGDVSRDRAHYAAPHAPLAKVAAPVELTTIRVSRRAPPPKNRLGTAGVVLLLLVAATAAATGIAALATARASTPAPQRVARSEPASARAETTP